MMAVERELRRACKFDPRRKEERQSQLRRLAIYSQHLSDRRWDELSEEAQAWCNLALVTLDNPIAPDDVLVLKRLCKIYGRARVLLELDDLNVRHKPPNIPEFQRPTTKSNRSKRK